MTPFSRSLQFLLASLLFCLTIQNTFAQWSQQGSKLVAAGGSGSSQRGSSVAISTDGTTAVVGGANDASTVGCVWIYTRSGETWTQQGNKLVGTTVSGTAFQGNSVAISSDGNTVLVGGLGAAWVYTRTGTTWSQQGSPLVGTGATGQTDQGRSVALSSDGNTAVLGGPSDNSNKGAVWVFTRSGGTWSQQGSKLVGTGSTAASQQGWGLGISGDGNTIIAGAPLDSSGVGAVWVYTRSGSAWSQAGSKILVSGATGAPGFGHSVAISADGNTAAIGGYTDNSSLGAVWIFTRNGSTWTQQSKVTGTGTSGTNVQQGWSVALSSDGNRLIEGGFLDGGGPGAAWIFSRSGSTWSQEGAKHVGTGAVGSAWQGYAVALTGDGLHALVGGLLDASNTGAVWAYGRGASNFTSTPLSIGTTEDLRGVSFITSTSGFVAGTHGTVRVTTNGGTTWTASTTGTTVDLTGIRLIGTSGFIIGPSGFISRSTNNGTSWVPFTTSTGETFNGVSFTSETAGWAAGTNGVIFRFNGTTWTLQTTGTTNEFRGVVAIGTTGYAVGVNGTIYRFNGTNWVSQTSGTTSTLHDVSFTSELIGYAAGASGTILRTTNGGTTWATLSSGVTTAIRSIRALSASVAFAAGDGGVFLQTSNGGSSWQTQSLGSSSNLMGIDVAGGQGVVVGAGGSGYAFQSPLTGVNESFGRAILPASPVLEQNYPNPFNPSTHIRFQLPNTGHVSLKVYSMAGQEVAALVNEVRNAGSHEVTFAASRLASGVYIYKLTAGGFTTSKKLLLLK